MRFGLFLFFFCTLPVLAEKTYPSMKYMSEGMNIETSEVIVQQQITVTGMVVDNDGFPLPGVTILVKGTTQGTTTNEDGAYSLELSGGNVTLVFSYVGFVIKEIQVAGRRKIDVTLAEDVNLIDEVVVIGYGTMQKRQVTSSIASLSSDDLPVGVGGTDIAVSLQGKVAGLVMAGNDSPNSESNFQLRGMGSINASYA